MGACDTDVLPPFKYRHIFLLRRRLVLGVTLSVVFQLPHCVEEAEFPIPREDTGQMERPWAVHQAHVTVDYDRDNRNCELAFRGLELSQRTSPVPNDLPHSLPCNHEDRRRNLSRPWDKVLGAQVILGRYRGALPLAQKDGSAKHPRLMGPHPGAEFLRSVAVSPCPESSSSSVKLISRIFKTDRALSSTHVYHSSYFLIRAGRKGQALRKSHLHLILALINYCINDRLTNSYQYSQ